MKRAPFVSATEAERETGLGKGSCAYPARDVVPVLRQLRRLLPPEIPIWAGGAGLSRVMTTRKGVRILSSLDEAVAALKASPLQHTLTEPP